MVNTIKLFNIFKKKETAKERRERVENLCFIGRKDTTPAMDAQVALDELQRYLLGEDWYIVTPMHTGQVNTEIVIEIESKYPKAKNLYGR